MTTTQVAELLKLGKDFGLRSLSVEGFHAEYSTERDTTNDQPFTPDFAKQRIGGDHPTDDEMLFYSVPDVQDKPPTENE